jgi:hypothetical protein
MDILVIEVQHTLETNQISNSISCSTIYSLYYLVVIHINSHFAEFEPMNNISASSFLDAFKSLFKNVTKIISLESDEKASLISKNVLKDFEKKNIDYYVVPE